MYTCQIDRNESFIFFNPSNPNSKDLVFILFVIKQEEIK